MRVFVPKPDDFGALLARHLDAAYNLARWLMQDRAAAEDVVQDALLRAVRYREGFRGDSARAWLLQIVRSCAYTALAARAPAAADAGLARLPDPAPDPEAVLTAKQDSAMLATLLAGLPAELQECLVLRELEGLPYKEIAVVTGVPIGTVMSRLWRARRTLADLAREHGA